MRTYRMPINNRADSEQYAVYCTNCGAKRRPEKANFCFVCGHRHKDERRSRNRRFLQPLAAFVRRLFPGVPSKAGNMPRRIVQPVELTLADEMQAIMADLIERGIDPGPVERVEGYKALNSALNQVGLQARAYRAEIRRKLLRDAMPELKVESVA